MRQAVIVRVTETEFETDEGKTFPHPVPFEPRQVPSVGDFQKWYDHWFEIFLDEYAGERISVRPLKAARDDVKR